MIAKWIIEHQMKRYFENKFDLRARTSIGKFKDTIRRANFANEMEKHFEVEEIKAAIKHQVIAKEQIMQGHVVRNIYVWLGAECVYQPIWYKRWAGKMKDFFLKVRSIYADGT